MKKILLFMLPLVALSFASCEKDNGDELSGDDIIQFEDAHFLYALLTIQEIEMYDAERGDYIYYMVDVDTNKDGQISVNEAQKVRGLCLFDYDAYESFNILSMPEIKYFTSLEYLDCFGNQLTSLDLSKNTALTYLSCDENQLTSLDLSKNTALTDLYCGSNQLTSLDVSNNNALTSLGCVSNQLTSLDLSKNTALTSLGCNNNQLTSLDLSNNTALESLQCGNNQFTTLDLSENTELTELWCHPNPFTKIILNKNNKILVSNLGYYNDIIEYVE